MPGGGSAERPATATSNKKHASKGKKGGKNKQDEVFAVPAAVKDGVGDGADADDSSEITDVGTLNGNGKASVAEEAIAFTGKKKSKGKNARRVEVDDDEFMPIDDVPVPDAVSAVEEIIFTGKKKSKGKSSKKVEVDDDEFLPIDDVPIVEAVSIVAKNAGKGQKEGKNAQIREVDDDEILLGNEVPTLAPAAASIASKTTAKGKKSGKPKQEDLYALLAELDEGSVDADEAGEDDASELPSSNNADRYDNVSDPSEEIIFTGKKKAKGKKGKLVIELESEISENGVPLPLDGAGIEEKSFEVEEAELDSEGISFTGKKKAKKGKKDTKKSLDQDYGDAFTEAKSAAPVPNDVVEPPIVEQPLLVESNTAVAKKKGAKKGKKSGRTAQEEEDLDALLAELDGPKVIKPVATPLVEASPTPVAPAVAPEAVTEVAPPLATTDAKAEPEDVVESAAAKKKKKKKEKEKEKAKAASMERPQEVELREDSSQGKQEESKGKPVDSSKGKQEDAKGKLVDKKVPKHLRAMQEQLAKMKEAEEKRKREEEDKIRKEEEEQARVEELERQKEEAKKRRKEREKEKLLQKKKEGKLLTGKQREEARRLALMREKFLAQAGLAGEGDSDPPDDTPPAPRKPKYETKKKRKGAVGPQLIDDHDDAGVPEDPAVHVDDVTTPIDVAVEEQQEMDIEPPVEEEQEMETIEELCEVEDPEEEEEEEEEDWDKKSWNEEDVALPAIKSAFAEEEDDAKPKVTAGKVSKRVSAQAPAPSRARNLAVAQPPASPSKPIPLVVAAPAKRPAPVEKRPAPVVKRVTQQKPVAPTHAQSEDEEDSGTEVETESEEEDDADAKKRRLARERREARKTEALTKRSADDLRSPICCILGHVDTGKTKLLDCIRRTNVQEGEAGGITQQIGATYFPMENIRERTKELKTDAKLRVPGLLVIDTPGHESFTNLRSRGSSLCDIAILVIDIMHGLEPQTIESINLLKMRHTPFVVALNKVDRLYDWKSSPNAPIRNVLKLQTKHVIGEFENRTTQIITQLKEQGLNSELYYKNKEIRKVISIVPTSAVSGEGIPDLLMLLVQLTQKMMEEKLMFVSELQCTVLEVKMIEGLGTTIDVVLVNGTLHEGDQIVVCGMQGPIVSNIRALLTPHPMKELRVKGSYEKHKELKAAQGIKITGQGLEQAIAGTQLYVVGSDDELEDIKEEAMKDMKNVMSRVDKSGDGVCVQASTLGSLEALLEFLKSPDVKIPVRAINIGPVHKTNVMRASTMLEKKRKEYATILAFDVKVTPEAKELADELGVKIFTADIIYHLFDQFTNYINSVKEEKRKESAEEAVFPCVLKILPDCVFNKKDPIVVGVDVLEGIAKTGTPICIPSRGFIEIGKIASMEVNHKVVDTAKKGGQAVAMKIIGTNAEESQKMFGRHFDHDDELVSSISRRSIDLLKENYRDDLSMDDWRLLVKLKKLFEIP